MNKHTEINRIYMLEWCCTFLNVHAYVNVLISILPASMCFLWDNGGSTINKKRNNNASSDFIENKQPSKSFQGICWVRRRFIKKKNIYHHFQQNQHFQFDRECLKEKEKYVSKQNHLTQSNPLLENCRWIRNKPMAIKNK